MTTSFTRRSALATMGAASLVSMTGQAKAADVTIKLSNYPVRPIRSARA